MPQLVSRLIEDRKSILMSLTDPVVSTLQSIQRVVETYFQREISLPEIANHINKLQAEGLVRHRGKNIYLTREGEDLAYEYLDIRLAADRLLVDEGLLGR